ncbi:acyltransferase family protein [Pseudarthrobacter oxydans]|uniref:acyltransferase family protein n=1 Tax=Pseudarthrobacter oxydans TaxID=1671 RepID=UPI0034395FEC
MGEYNELQATSRYTGLDGLRGLAALVVVIHHCGLVSPQLSAAVDSNGTGSFEPWVWWTTFTPLHLLWAGHEAVYTFFILSGFVIALPFLRNSPSSWATYYPKRLVRIYLPVWASLVIALLMAWTVPRTAGSELSYWVNLHDEAPHVLADAFLLRGAGSLNSPLWSLQWEMLFSLLLPIYVIGARSLGRYGLPGLLGLFILMAAGNLMRSPLLVYMTMFGVGVLMASQREVLGQWGRKLGRSAWLGLIAASVILLCSRWLFPPLPVGIATAALDGALLIFVFLVWPPAISLGNGSLVRWLGLRSFSLYLIHEPIVLSVTFALRSTNAFHVLMLALPLSLLVTEVFFRLIERPSHRLAEAAGRVIVIPPGVGTKDRKLMGKLRGRTLPPHEETKAVKGQ